MYEVIDYLSRRIDILGVVSVGKGSGDFKIFDVLDFVLLWVGFVWFLWVWLLE